VAMRAIAVRIDFGDRIRGRGMARCVCSRSGGGFHFCEKEAGQKEGVSWAILYRLFLTIIYWEKDNV
jgi:hypothetical protein